MNILLWTHIGTQMMKEGWKYFYKCYTIALKFWGEFNECQCSFVVFLKLQINENLVPLSQKYVEKQ